MRNWIIRFFVLAIILVGVGQQLLAQSKTSVIKGFVTELDKSPVMYASVVLKNEQNDILTKLDKHHKATMQQLHVLREFDQISDMTNQIFERRLSSIEQTLKERKKIY